MRPLPVWTTYDNSHMITDRVPRCRRPGATPLALATVAVIVGCGDSGRQMPTTDRGEPSRTTIGVSFDLLNELRRAEIDAIRVEARRSNAVVELAVANNDAGRQAAQIRDLIRSDGVDAVIAIPQDRRRIVGSIREATRARVPFIVMDRAAAPGARFDLQVTGDPVADGEAAARAMVRLRRPLRVLHLWGAVETDENAEGRRDGFNRAVSGTRVRVVAEAPTGWDPQVAATATRRALRADPRINAIFIPSDFLLPAVSSVLEEAGRMLPIGRPGHVAIVTVDGDPIGCRALRERLIDADVAAPVEAMARQAVLAALEAAQGRRMRRPAVEIPGRLLTRATVKREGSCRPAS